GRLVEWLRSVDDRPRNQPALTAVTNTGPARPTDRNVARLSQLQDALVGRRLPACSDATARKRYQWTGFRVVLGQVRRSRRYADDTGSHRFAAVEDFDVNPLRSHAQGRECFFHIGHKRIGDEEIKIRLWRDADLFEDRPRQVARSDEIFTHLIARVRPAITD